MSTSEYHDVTERLQVLVNRGRIEDAKEAKDRPTLRRSTQTAPADKTSTDKTEGTEGSQTGKPEEEKSDEDDRPTLRRR